jgi:hypothetical protein
MLFAFLPLPVMVMDGKAERRWEHIIGLRVPAIAIFIADDARGRARGHSHGAYANKRRESQYAESFHFELLFSLSSI